ncbi:hypothetical protein BVX97_04495 [bacterium E08(2017)]|nr:hypothetical protein BVX97_04495 [bacterium E08(2017)]
MSRHDLKWTKMPKEWYEAPFLGNGMMGTMVRQTGDKTVRWDVGRGDVQNHGQGVHGANRLPIGHFELHTEGTITGGDMHLSLWNAEATGTIQTDKGSIKWRSFVHTDLMVIITEIEPSKGERECRWEWKPAIALNPKLVGAKNQQKHSRNNPAPIRKRDGNIDVTTQHLTDGGEYVTAWQEIDKGKQRLLLTTVALTYPKRTAKQEAVDVIKHVKDISMDTLTQSHRAWWHEWYPTSFVTLPDAWWESFYWIQMYKLASGTRSDRMLLDLNGPWLQPTPWPASWWNLNIQLTYSPVYASGRLDIGESLCRTIYDNMDNLIQNVPAAYQHDSAGIGRVSGQYCKGTLRGIPGEHRVEAGNLVWACHNLWLHYRHSMDDDQLREQLYPLLKRAVNFYLHFLEEGDDGKLHLPKTHSPEYIFAEGPDTNYDLALLRWGCTTLIKASERLGIEDPRRPEWDNVLMNLTDYPMDENGYMVARDVPFAKGHRHYSHLMMNYPLYLVNINQPGAKELATRSVKHWQSLGARQGYSLTGASSISSAYGMGNEALEYLNGLKPYIQANTMYKEAGPVIETPLSGAQSIHDILIQSWDGVIRVFPAVADKWDNVAFHDLLTEGAFSISAKREDGKTAFVSIKSLKGEPCIFASPFEGEFQVSGSREFRLKELDNGLHSLDLKQGEQAILWSGGKMPKLTISPIPPEPGKRSAFGLR